MGRTRKSVAIAPFLHRQCQWSGEYASMRKRNLFLEKGVETCARNLKSNVEDNDEFVLIFICRTILDELQRGTALRLSELRRLFPEKYKDSTIHAAAELLVSCEILKRLGPLIPFHTFYAATHTAFEPCVADDGLTLAKLANGLEGLYDSLEMHIHGSKGQPVEGAKEAQTKPPAPPRNNQSRRSNLDHALLDRPMRPQDHKERGKPGANGTYRLEQDLTGEEGHRLHVFVRLNSAAQEQEAALGTRKHIRGPWKFTMHSTFTALPAFPPGLSMKDFMNWLHTTVNMKAQRKSGGGLSSQSLQSSTTNATVTGTAPDLLILVQPKIEAQVSVPLVSLALQNPEVSTSPRIPEPEPALRPATPLAMKKKEGTLIATTLELAAKQKSGKMGLGPVIPAVSMKLPGSGQSQTDMLSTTEKVKEQCAVYKPRKKFAAPVSLKPDVNQRLSLNVQPQLVHLPPVAHGQAGMVAENLDRRNKECEGGTRVASLETSRTAVSVTDWNREVCSGQPGSVAPVSSYVLDLPALVAEEKSASGKESQAEVAKLQTAQTRHISIPATGEASLSKVNPVVSAYRRNHFTKVTSTSSVASGQMESNEQKGAGAGVAMVKVVVDGAEQEPQAQQHFQALTSAGAHAAEKSSGHVSTPPVKAASVKVECMPENVSGPAMDRPQTRRSARLPPSNHPGGMLGTSLLVGPLLETNVGNPLCALDGVSLRNMAQGVGGEQSVDKSETSRKRGCLSKTVVEEGSRVSSGVNACGRIEGGVRAKKEKPVVCPLKTVVRSAEVVLEGVLPGREKGSVRGGALSKPVCSSDSHFIQISLETETGAASVASIAGATCTSDRRKEVVAENVEASKGVVESRKSEKRRSSRQAGSQPHCMMAGSTGLKQIFEALERLLPGDSHEESTCEKGKVLAAMAGGKWKARRISEVESSVALESGDKDPVRAGERVGDEGQSNAGGARRCRIKREPAVESLGAGAGLGGMGASGMAGGNSGMGQTNSGDGGTVVKRKVGRPRKVPIADGEQQSSLIGVLKKRIRDESDVKSATISKKPRVDLRSGKEVARAADGGQIAIRRSGRLPHVPSA